MGPWLREIQLDLTVLLLLSGLPGQRRGGRSSYCLLRGLGRDRVERGGGRKKIVVRREESEVGVGRNVLCCSEER